MSLPSTLTGAIDVGGTKIAVGLVQGRQILARRTIPTQAALRYGEAVDTLAQLLFEMSAQVGKKLGGIGIGITGRLESAQRRLAKNDFLPDWTGRDLVGDLESKFGLPVGIENDADAAALAENVWGAGQGKARFIYVTVSTGIGGGIVINGQLYRGLDGAHPEIGHHTIDPSGPACFCGASGCWERFASGTAMQARVRVTAPPQAAAETLDARRICEYADQGTPWALQEVGKEAYYLGLGLANLITIFAPDGIALGGGVMRRWPLFAERALAVVRQNCRLVPAQQVAVQPAALGEDTPLIGAALACPLDRASA